jgi:uncharacterized membrane protein
MVGVAVVLVSWAMLKGVFSRSTAYLGLAVGVIAIAAGTRTRRRGRTA